MDCPRDRTALMEVKLDDRVMDQCPLCGGIWFDFAELERVFTRETHVLRRLLPESGTQPQPDADGLPCPRCGETLIRMRAGHRAVIYYGCLTCYGHWLDGHVIERVVGRSLTIKFERLFQQLLE